MRNCSSDASEGETACRGGELLVDVNRRRWTDQGLLTLHTLPLPDDLLIKTWFASVEHRRRLLFGHFHKPTLLHRRVIHPPGVVVTDVIGFVGVHGFLR